MSPASYRAAPPRAVVVLEEDYTVLPRRLHRGPRTLLTRRFEPASGSTEDHRQAVLEPRVGVTQHGLTRRLAVPLVELARHGTDGLLLDHVADDEAVHGERRPAG